MNATSVGWIVLVASIGVMVVTFGRAMRKRQAFARVRKGPLYGGSITARTPGSAAATVDGGQVASQELLGALGIRAESEQDYDQDDAGIGSILGLHHHPYRHDPGTGLWDPTVYDGTRNGHQVFIRSGRNATVRGPGLNFRRMRSVCAVRVAVPAFEVVAAGGRLRAQGAAPAALAAMLQQLAPSPDVWHDLRVVAGAEGMVANRAVSSDWVGGWIYDLWLLERIAACLGGTPLPPESLGREWSPPYGMGDWAPSIGETLDS